MDNEKNFLDIQEDATLKDDKIIIKDDKGNEKECDILFSFDCEQNNRNYIGYTDNTRKDGLLNIYVAYSDIFESDGSLKNVETDEEIAMVNDVIKQIIKECENE